MVVPIQVSRATLSAIRWYVVKDLGASLGELPPDTTARLQSGALEGSNVSPVETMVAMIAAARVFEQQMKMLQGADQREQAASKLLGPAGV